MNLYIVLLIFIIGILTGYSLHESKDKIEIHDEANKIFNEYQETRFNKTNIEFLNRSDLCVAIK